MIKCHIKQADATFKGTPADDETCETGDPAKSAKAKLDAAMAKLATVCSGTAIPGNVTMLESTLFAPTSTSGSADDQNGDVYCDGSTPIDGTGEDAGTVNTDGSDAAKNGQKCADTVWKSLGKLIGAVAKCHVKAADSQFATPPKIFDEENGCEETAGGKGAKEKYDAATNAASKINALCPVCLPAMTRGMLGSNFISLFESINDKFYPCAAPTCGPVVVGQPIANTYKLQGIAPNGSGEKRCVTNSPLLCNAGSRSGLSCSTDNTNSTTGCPGATCPGCCVSKRFQTCNVDADCGGSSCAQGIGCCLELPWVTADGQVMGFAATATTFTVAPGGVGSYPTCEHQLCIPCGNPHAPCAGVPGCEAKHCNAGSRNAMLCTTDDTNATTGCPGATCPGCCVLDNQAGCQPRGTQGCCDQPGFIVPTFNVNILGGLCSRVDQLDCGLGVVNTSNPQTGDNNVIKNADTSDPGADCCYNGQPASECVGGVNLGDDPAPLTCSPTGAGNDYKGKIVRTIGNGSADAPGVHFRLNTPELSTTWMDSNNPCPDGSTFDDSEKLGLVSQLIIKAEPTSAGASGAFVDMNGDSCKRAGAGFTTSSRLDTDGPITVPGATDSPIAGPARPQSYDGTQGAVTVTVSEVLSGPNSPIRDIGYVAITPVMPAQVVAAQSCSCNVTPGCPE